MSVVLCLPAHLRVSTAASRGRPGPVRACVCSSVLTGSGRPASRARFGVPHLLLWPLCLSALLGPLRAAAAPFVVLRLHPPPLFFSCCPVFRAAPPLCPCFFCFRPRAPWALPPCFSFLLPPRLVFFFPSCAPFVSGFLWFPAPGALSLGAVCCLFCWPPAPRLSVRSRLFCGPRLAVGSSLVVVHPPLFLCVAVFLAAPFCSVFFISLRAPVLFGFLWFPAPGALGMGAVCCLFVGLWLLGSPCAPASFVVPAWPLAAVGVCAPPPFVSRCFSRCRPVLRFFFPFFSFFFLFSLPAPVVSGFLWFPAPAALGSGAVCCLFCWPPAPRLSVRSGLICGSRLVGGCSLVLADPPPLSRVSLFFSLLLCAPCFSFSLRAPVVSGFIWFLAPDALGLGAVCCLCCLPLAPRPSVRSRLFCGCRLAVDCSLVVAAPPPASFVSRCFSRCRFVLRFFFSRCAPPLSLTFSGFQPWVPWAWALRAVCVVGLSLLGSPCALASFVFPATAVGCSLVVAAPPPLVPFSLFLSLPLCASFLLCVFFLVVCPRCLWLSLVSGPGCPGPWRCVLLVLLAPRPLALRALSPLLWCPPGRWLLPGGCCPPPLFVCRCFPRCPLVLPPPFFCRCVPLLSLALSGFRPQVPWALALRAVCVVRLSLLGSPCALASFVVPAWPLAAPWWLLPPPPPLFLAVFCAAALCSVFLSRCAPHCLRLFLVSGPGCPGPWRCVLFVLLASRSSALRALLPLWCFPPGCWLLLGVCCPPPPLGVSRFSGCCSVRFFFLVLCSSVVLAACSPSPLVRAWCLVLSGFAALLCPLCCVL